MLTPVASLPPHNKLTPPTEDPLGAHGPRLKAMPTTKNRPPAHTMAAMILVVEDMRHGDIGKTNPIMIIPIGLLRNQSFA